MISLIDNKCQACQFSFAIHGSITCNDFDRPTKKGNKALSHKEIVDLIESEAKSIYRGGSKPKVNCISVKGIGEGILKDIARRFQGKYKSVDPAKV